MRVDLQARVHRAMVLASMEISEGSDLQTNSQYM